jgi:hypothetical protein
MHIHMPFVDNIDLSRMPDPHHIALGFGNEVIRRIPGAKLAHRNPRWLWVYMPNEHVPRGAIGYSCESGKATTFNVLSPSIKNGKFHDGREQYRMAMSVNETTALKNALTHLRAVKPADLQDLTWSAFRESYNLVGSNLRGEIMSIERELFSTSLSVVGTPRVLNELRQLLETGHTFVDPEMRQLLTTYFNLKTELANGRVETPMAFITATMHGDQQVFTVMRTSDGNRYHATWEEPEVYVDELPEHLAGRVAVMSMAEQGVYVEGVGYKATPRLFYVVI